jgi:plasmid stabilization system protein ParE
MPDLPPGDVRKFPMGNYLIYYRALPGKILIARVLHGKRIQRRAFLKKPQK